jgi:hypothetical protein
MDSFGSKEIWKVQLLLCYLSCMSRSYSCFFGGKALGPMPPRRESLQHFARVFRNISTLLLFASTKLKETILKPGRAVEAETLCLVSFPQLAVVREVLGPVFHKLAWDITQWAWDKSKSRSSSYPFYNLQNVGIGVASPLNAERYKKMDELISFAEVSVFEILHELKPLLGSSFETASHM